MLENKTKKRAKSKESPSSGTSKHRSLIMEKSPEKSHATIPMKFGFYEYSDDDEDFFDESEKSTVDFYDETNDTEEDSGNGTLTRIKCSSSPEIPAKKRKSTSKIINGKLGGNHKLDPN